MYRILIKESIVSNKNTFYVEDNEIYETDSIEEIANKYKELVYQYPKSRINIVDNTIENVLVDFYDEELQQIDDMINDILG